MITSLPQKRLPKMVWLLPACVLLCGIVVIALYPDLLYRWFEYNRSMVRRIFSNLVPYVWIQLGLVAIVFLIEIIAVGWTRSSLRLLTRPDKSMINDICGFIVSILHIDTILIFVLTLGLTHKLENGLKLAVDYKDGFLAAYVPSIPLQVIIYILIADFILFFEHYLHHKIRFLWNFHSFHHSATELNVFTGNRSHPFQAEFFNTLIAFVPMTLMGVPLASLFLFRMLRNTIVLMQHSRIPWSWGWLGKYLICSPAYHRIHHSVLPEHHDKNLAVLFPMWDFIFNTNYKGTTKPGAMGIPDSPYNQSTYVQDLLIPFKMLRRKK